MLVFKGVCAAFLILMSVSCALRPRPTSSPHSVAPQASPESRAARVYRIDAEQSELRVLVYRSGPLAHFGHNHVLVNRALSGSVNLATEQTASSFSFTVPAADFIVDDAQSRREEGPDFPGEIPEEAKTGTLHNMLSSALLNAAEYQVIAVDSGSVGGTREHMTVGLIIRVAGHESRIDAPFILQSDLHRLTATGTLDLRQSTIGLTPYSLMLGALQVQDTVRLKFKIVALAS